MKEEDIDRLAFAIVHSSYAHGLLKALNQERFQATVIEVKSGLLEEPMVTLLVGMNHRKLPSFFELVKAHCPARLRYVPVGAITTWPPSFPHVVEVSSGGATVLVVPVEKFYKI